MTTSFRWLVWLALLIGGLSVTLDWQEEIEQLRPERERLERLREREQSSIWAVDWVRLSKEAGQAQLTWLDRLPEVNQIGVFRAEAMESMSDLCQRLQAPCQVAAMGETAAPMAQNQAGSRETVGRPANAAQLVGLVTTSVRITTSLNDTLMPLLLEIENGPVLRQIEKFTVRSGRADFIVKTYGLDQRAAQVTRSAAQLQASEGQATADKTTAFSISSREANP
ncbi:MAG: hypothetical protein U1D25_06165 [Hydrogenophaga sp.]|uniref:hypothetical protein n=1 Tax=Hydrogenophaga sp. TaxID=1904254 RepID=UPI002AB8C42D|nr:hypothetical protein [Hydrogenophaga sp.]MDZ4187678.1 hypothetical protein [Hydrogenophaga sp.]